LFSNNGQQSGATPQTTVPVLVYVGPHTGEDTPSGNGLALMFPPNSPFPTGGIGGCPESYPPPPNAQYPIPCPPPGTQGTGASLGAYPLTINVPAGYGPGIPGASSQLANPTLITVTGLNNTAFTNFVVKPPTVSSSLSPAVTITNAGNPFGGASSNCTSTYAQFSSLPLSPLGPTCSWSIWVDSTALTGTVTGTLTFTADATSFPFTTLVVPLTINVSDFPNLNVTQPIFFPNPTFGTGIPQPNFCGTNTFPVGCPQQLVGIPIPATGIVLQSQQFNSSFACAEIGINTNGGGWTPTSGVQQVTIAPFTVPWLSTQISTAPYLGNIPSYGFVPVVPNVPGFTTGWGFDGGFGMEGGPGSIGALIPIPLYYTNLNSVLSSAAQTQQVPSADWSTCTSFSSSQPCSAVNTVAPYPAGPATVNNAMQTLQLCANTDPLGNATGTFRTTATINGAGVGPVVIPVTFNITSASGSVPPNANNTAAEMSEIAVFRNSGGSGVWFEASPSNAPDANMKIRSFGLPGDQPVTGDFLGNGTVEIGVFRCSGGTCNFFVDLNNNGQFDGIFGGDAIWNFGLPGDIAVVGDWNGTGVSKIGVVRCPPAGGLCIWYLDIGNKHTFDPATVGVYAFGLTGDKPVVGLFNPPSSSGPAEAVGVFRCTTTPGTICAWYFTAPGALATSQLFPTSSVPVATGPIFFGLTGDQPVVANWNGNGVSRIGVFRNGQWLVNTSGNGTSTDQIFNFGLPGDTAVTGFFSN